jgi:macrodomain Ter protein organizer (MatP/YcbG family)
VSKSIEIENQTWDMLSERAAQKNTATDEYINQLLSEIAEKVEPVVQRDRSKGNSKSDVEDRLRDLGYL